jgi:hypothetical protein
LIKGAEKEKSKDPMPLMNDKEVESMKDRETQERTAEGNKDREENKEANKGKEKNGVDEKKKEK